MKIEKGESVNTFSLSRAARLGVWFFLAVFALILMSAGPVRAQVEGGSISGSVTDATGSLVPDVAITATNADTKEQASTKSDSAGLFRLNSLGIGNYDVEFTKQGFKKTVIGGVSVAAGADHGLGTIALQLGAVTVTVEVSAAPALIESTQSQITTALSSQYITDYAGLQENQGLDFLALQLPGVAAVRDQGFSNTNGVGFSVNGLRGRSNDQEIDGQNNNDNSVAGPALFLSNPDFVEQYQITTNNFAPEYGRNSGSVVNEITPSGKNNWHGTIAGSEQNQDLNSRNNIQKALGEGDVPWFNTVFASTTAGGPLVKDKFFLFGGFDTNISESNSFASNGNQPDPIGLAELAACYPNSDSVAAIRSFGAFGIGAGNPVVSPGSTLVVPTLGPTGTGSCPVEVSSFQRQLGTPFHEYDFITREDWVKGANRFYARYLYNKTNFINGGGGDLAGGYFFSVPALSQGVLVGWSRPITNNMTNEFRLSYGRLNVEFGGNTFGNTVAPASDLANALANVGIAKDFTAPDPVTGNQTQVNFDPFGPANNIPQARIVNTYQIQENWSYVHGKSQWKAGGNFTYQQSPNVFLPNFNGSYNFGTFTAPAGGNFVSKNSAGATVCSLPAGTKIDSLTAFACDIPSSISATNGPTELGFKEYDTFLYVGNDYKLRPNLTINLGLTWTYFGQPANIFNSNDLRQQNGPQPFWDPALPLSVTTTPKIPSVKDAFGPGVGFAYTPRWGERWFGSDKTVIRGGYRLSYDPPFYNIYLNQATAAPQVLAQSLNNTGPGGVVAGNLPLLPVPIGTDVRNQLTTAGVLTFGVQDPRFFNQTSISPNFKPDGVHSWSFGLQRELGKGVAFEARYVGNYGFNLYQSINANPFIADTFNVFPNIFPAGVTPCTTGTPTTTPGFGRVNCDEGIIRERTNSGYSHYNGLQLDLRTGQLFHQLTLHSSYTWSKNTDNVSEIFSTGGGGTTIAFSQNPLNFTSGENGLSGLDFPQSWTLSFTEAIPFFRQQEGPVGHFLGGWILTGNYILQSGQTYSPSQVLFGTLSGGVGQDSKFDQAFIGSSFDETLRPFLSNHNAPAGQVGIYAGDACSIFAIGCVTASGAPVPVNTLLSLNAINQTGAATTVTTQQVRFILNGLESQTLAGSPYAGTAGRNSLRDFHTNTGNFSLIKRFKINERAHFDFRTDFLNVFNHRNYGSVDPFVEDAGLFLPTQAAGFANNQVTSGGARSIAFVAKLVY